MVIDENNDLRWSTEFGAGFDNGLRGIAVSDEYIFITGISENTWTLWDYDAQSILDYYLPELGNNDPSDGTIARFNILTTVGITENQQPSALVDTWSLYPNPTNESITLAARESLETGTLISIFDATGALVKQERVQSRNSQLYIYLGDLSIGMYTCTVTLDKKYFKPISFIKQ